MANSKVRSVIDNLSTERLKDFLEQVLDASPELQQKFLETFEAQSDSDVLTSALYDLDQALSTIDSDEYVRLSYEYWDEDAGQPVEELIDSTIAVIEDTCETLLQQHNYELYRDFLIQAAERIRDFDLSDIVVSDLGFDSDDDTAGIKDVVSTRIQSLAAEETLPDDIREELQQTLDEIFADDFYDGDEE